MDDKEKTNSKETDKQQKSDAKPIVEEKRRHSLGPDLLWEELP